MEAGQFITFEGGEGAGKTTQAKLLCDALENAGVETLLTREPGGTFGAEAIRDLVLSGSNERWSGMTELLLMYAARLDHVEKLIKPALARGAWVISDRFADSSLAYQGYARGLGAQKVKELHDTIMDGFEPNLTVLFDIDPILAQKRVEMRGENLSRFDKQDIDFHNVLRDAFLDIAHQNADRFVTVDAGAGREAIHARIIHVLTMRYPSLAGKLSASND
ncbi:thymidylate kinase [Litorimonas taeanensis]|uniref:Thymidylate kinase n=1 Tax=Litorimonas taeanensis TaxID=568099 RepID=A0A420WK39_9PROT|nr:dTMP kinase [Litorimonas taeanensis]RKQ71374.1 thymidylate kinase [Litorimonas taeanensis]